MKKITILILSLSFFSCSTPKITKPKKDFTVKNLKDFFLRCEQDLDNSSKVIVEKDIVKNLTHLQRMNFGGKRYYILERESITEMIKAVTVGIYDDFILLNKHGVIVYTMRNNQLFAKNIKSKELPIQLLNAYNNRSISYYFQSINTFDSTSQNYSMIASKKVSGINSFPGIFILQINTDKIRKVLPTGVEITSLEGKYLLTNKPQDMENASPYYQYVDMKNKGAINKRFVATLNDGRQLYYWFFNHRNINWILYSIN